MDNKQAYVEKIDAQLNEWKARIDQLKAKGQNAKADATIDYNDAARKLQDQIEALSQKKKELQDAAADKWEQVRDQVDDTISQTKKELERLTAPTNS
jgi:hypothetical protein